MLSQPPVAVVQQSPVFVARPSVEPQTPEAELRAAFGRIAKSSGVVELSKRLLAKLETLETRAERGSAIDLVRQTALARLTELQRKNRLPETSRMIRQVKLAADGAKKRADGE